MILKIVLKQNGTKIIVNDLYAGISEKFSTNFANTLTEKIRTHYAYIIKKGLTIKLNGQLVKGASVELLFTVDGVDGNNIQPYIYEEDNDGVKVRVIVGLTGQSPGIEDIENATEDHGESESNAGWTIICNERVVLHADKTRLTGWGDGLPKFHFQFNTIVGIVEFTSNDASKLPVKTTKEGIDAFNRFIFEN